MPLIKESSYRPPWWLKNSHLSTVIPSLFREVKDVEYKRERIKTPDEDFIDLDWLKGDNDRLIVLLHGLEGGSDRSYMQGMAKYFNQKSWDVVAYNCRGCSGETNLQPRFIIMEILMMFLALLNILIGHLTIEVDHDRV